MPLHRNINYEGKHITEIIKIAWENLEHIRYKYEDRDAINNAYNIHVYPVFKELLKPIINILRNKHPQSYGLKDTRTETMSILSSFRHAFETTTNPDTIVWTLKTSGKNHTTFLAGNDREVILENYNGKDKTTLVLDKEDFGMLDDFATDKKTFEELMDTVHEKYRNK